jgi:AAA+ superfamily predicted ATPase
MNRRTSFYTSTNKKESESGAAMCFALAVLLAFLAVLFYCLAGSSMGMLPMVLVVFFGFMSLIFFLGALRGIGTERKITGHMTMTISKPPAMSHRWRRYINDMSAASREFYNFILELDRMPHITKIINDLPGMENFKGDCFTVKLRLALIVYCDLRDCFRELGHQHTNLYNLEGIGYAMMVGQLMSREFDISNFFNPQLAKKLTEIIEKVEIDFESSVRLDVCGHENEFRFGVIFGKAHGEWDLVYRYSTLMYRWASLIAKADGSVSHDESAVLAAIMKMSENPLEGNVSIRNSGTGNVHPVSVDRVAKANVPVTEKRSQTGTYDPMQALDALIGLGSVKEEVRKLASFIKIQGKRKSSGLTEVPISYHCVFTGNPGTGKTTVARILADIYRELGIVKSGHLVETDRSGLVAEYVGQTAIKTNKVIDEALDGVLFIDEAYTLVGEGSDYGAEAIATLLKRMEDDRDRLVVILAGYTNEIKEFIDSNPGLQSRFNRYIQFDDYSAEELTEIFKRNLRKSRYKIKRDAFEELQRVVAKAVASRDKNFGNARFVRNLFEKVVQNQANRLAKMESINNDELSLITREDINF